VFIERGAKTYLVFGESQKFYYTPSFAGTSINLDKRTISGFGPQARRKCSEPSIFNQVSNTLFKVLNLIKLKDKLS
jgi:hypothetical protein